MLKALFLIIYLPLLFYIFLDLESFENSFFGVETLREACLWICVTTFVFTIAVSMMRQSKSNFIIYNLIFILDLFFISFFYKANYYNHPNIIFSNKIVHDLFHGNQNDIRTMDDINNDYSRNKYKDLAKLSIFTKSEPKAFLFLEKYTRLSVTQLRERTYMLTSRQLKSYIQSEKEFQLRSQKEPLEIMQEEILKNMPKTYIKKFISLTDRKLIDSRILAYE